MTYQCKWCEKDVRVAQSTKANLKAHRDGSTQEGKNDKGCPQREAAIAAGAKLPQTVAQIKADHASDPSLSKSQSVTSFFGIAKKFDNKVLN